MRANDLYFIRQVSVYLQNWKEVEAGKIFNFRCPFCGDSERSKKKARAYLFYDRKHGYMFKCHNCEHPTNLYGLINRVSESLAKKYVFSNFSKDERRFQKASTIPELKFKPIKATSILSGMRKLIDMDKDHPAREYIEGRKIPKKWLAKLYWCNDVLKVAEKLPKYAKREEPVLSKPTGAIGIPMINQDGIIEFIQFRFLDGAVGDMRYMTLEVSGGAKIWGRDFVDYSKDYYMFEGPFDAMCVDNSIAAGGADLPNLSKYLQTKKLPILVFDKDYRTNVQILQQVEKSIELGFRVCLIDDEFPAKDVNEAIQNFNWGQSQVEDYLKRRTFSGLSAKLQLSNKVRQNVKNKKKSRDFRW